MLGEAGATVHCTGRSSRTQPNTSGHHYAGRPETIEETAEMVTAAGGVGIPVRVDHTIAEEVAAPFASDEGAQASGCPRQYPDRHGRSIVVQFLEQPLDDGRALVDGWIWPHIVTSWHAVPLMIKGKSGLMPRWSNSRASGITGSSSSI